MKEPWEDRLKAWHDVEPSPGFEDAVWRRIEAAPPTRIPAWRAVFDLLAARPALAMATGLAIGVMVGSALLSPSTLHADQFALLGGDSLAGNYMHLVEGGLP
jgi:hypothetical protein